MFFAHEHALDAALSVGKRYGQSGAFVFLITAADPADQVRIIEIIFLLTIGIITAQLHELPQIQHRGAVLDRVAVIVGVKHTGQPFMPQQDERIAVRSEPVRHKGLQTLAVLRVVIVHKGHGVLRTFFDQRVVKNCAQVKIRSCL